MFVLIRTMKLVKGYLNIYEENFKKESPLTKSPGFVKKEMFVNTKDKEFDIVAYHTYFKDKQSYYIWKGSDAHIAMHRNKANLDPKPEIIEVIKENYTLVTTVTND